MGLVQEFKNFAMKGNVIDLAVAFIIGGAFKAIISSLVKDVVMPAVGMAMGGVSFDQLYVNLSDKTFETMAAAVEAGAPIMKVGLFVQSIVDFIIIAFVVFMMVKMITRMQDLRKIEEEAEAAAEPAEELVLLREIRDSLKK